MEYKVTYNKTQYNLNAVLSFDLLKEILLKLLISQDNLENEIKKIKSENKKRDKEISKFGKIIKENVIFEEELYEEKDEKNDDSEEEGVDNKNIVEEKSEKNIEDIIQEKDEPNKEKNQKEIIMSPTINNETVKELEHENNNIIDIKENIIEKNNNDIKNDNEEANNNKDNNEKKEKSEEYKNISKEGGREEAKVERDDNKKEKGTKKEKGIIIFS